MTGIVGPRNAVRFLAAVLGTICVVVAGLWASVALWGAFSPVVLLHYSKDAESPIRVFFNDNDDTLKLGMTPGQTLRFRTAMFPRPDMWILITFPGQSPDHVELTQPFSRVDIFVGAGAKVERTAVHERFFARF
ncbi:hypothetical protein N8H69_13510 [Achromobacter spanius]|uniref:hypothetical protein n=1 Tax=Achromobacter spanius TaxID=217203 RepID=UPI000F8FBC1F|nr:hypothetical protein [Achromobacter spanius]AZS81438.1 hypothetical protein ELS24_25205 [Achromobacter spanius]MCW3153555.1 hypothetical protein [Achromobacter spanius]